MRKYELLLLTNNFKRQRDVNDIVNFLNELFEKNERKQFYLTYEMTLFIYNVVLNTINDYEYLVKKEWKERVKKTVMRVIRQLFEAEQLTDENISKIEIDINFIEKNKQYTYIYDIILYIYFFFFNT